mmetsp:Transcript_14670/g.28049  ORF Transcript_14670/g.28049 Transcript_14670/m.28049 type:complete len:82 (-) Transcript_14670:11-256(-)
MGGCGDDLSRTSPSPHQPWQRLWCRRRTIKVVVVHVTEQKFGGTQMCDGSLVGSLEGDNVGSFIIRISNETAKQNIYGLLI